MTPCEEKGYKVGQVFKVPSSYYDEEKRGDIIILHEDDGTQRPFFRCLYSQLGVYGIHSTYVAIISEVIRIYPPEEKSKDVTVVCEGKETVISRESAEKLGLCAT